MTESETTPHFKKEQIGYFTSPYPDAKPERDIDLPQNCPYCGSVIDETNVRTTNIAYLKDRQISAFIFSHRKCNDADTNNDLDGAVLDAISEMVKSGEINP